MHYLSLGLLSLSLLVANTGQCDPYQNECETAEDGSYDEVVHSGGYRCSPLLRGYYTDEQDPKEELEEDAAWPSRNEEFSDQLFTPNGGPW